jgi:hypothetical protein
VPPFSRLPLPAVQNRLPFISGLRRSGSTLLAALLRQNPRVSAGMSSRAYALFRSMLAETSARNEGSVFIDNDIRKRLLTAVFDAYYAEAAPDKANLARYPQVEVRARSGVEDLPKSDAIYVNAAATHPLRAWLDALKVGGRLLFPLQAAHSTGAMLLITRPESGDVWPARFLSAVVFIACEGAQDRATGRKLDEAFRRGGSERVHSLRFGGEPGRSDWLRGDGWALSTEGAD